MQFTNNGIAFLYVFIRYLLDYGQHEDCRINGVSFILPTFND